MILFYFCASHSSRALLGPTTGISDGYTLVVPDYEGFKSAFGAGHLSGHGVLDGIRAALNFPGAKLQKTAKIAVMGEFCLSFG